MDEGKGMRGRGAGTGEGDMRMRRGGGGGARMKLDGCEAIEKEMQFVIPLWRDVSAKGITAPTTLSAPPRHFPTSFRAPFIPWDPAMPTRLKSGTASLTIHPRLAPPFHQSVALPPFIGSSITFHPPPPAGHPPATPFPPRPPTNLQISSWRI